MHDCSGDCALARARDAADPSRRRFVSHALLASMATFLAACGDGNIGGVTGTGPGGTHLGGGAGLLVTLADFPVLAATGGIARVDRSTSRPVAVTRVDATTFLAFSMVCTHAGFRPIDIVAGGFECPNHGARFAANGSWTGGQHASALNRYTVAYDASLGTLLVT